jgi:hypothetical protein
MNKTTTQDQIAQLKNEVETWRDFSRLRNNTDLLRGADAREIQNLTFDLGNALMTRRLNDALAMAEAIDSMLIEGRRTTLRRVVTLTAESVCIGIKRQLGLIPVAS